MESLSSESKSIAMNHVVNLLTSHQLAALIVTSSIKYGTNHVKVCIFWLMIERNVVTLHSKVCESDVKTWQR